MKWNKRVSTYSLLLSAPLLVYGLMHSADLAAEAQTESRIHWGSPIEATVESHGPVAGKPTAAYRETTLAFVSLGGQIERVTRLLRWDLPLGSAVTMWQAKDETVYVQGDLAATGYGEEPYDSGTGKYYFFAACLAGAVLLSMSGGIIDEFRRVHAAHVSAVKV